MISGSVARNVAADRSVADAGDFAHEPVEEDRVAGLVDLLGREEVLLLLQRRGVDVRRQVVGDRILAVEEQRVEPQRARRCSGVSRSFQSTRSCEKSISVARQLPAPSARRGRRRRSRVGRGDRLLKATGRATPRIELVRTMFRGCVIPLRLFFRSYDQPGPRIAVSRTRPAVDTFPRPGCRSRAEAVVARSRREPVLVIAAGDAVVAGTALEASLPRPPSVRRAVAAEHPGRCRSARRPCSPGPPACRRRRRPRRCRRRGGRPATDLSWLVPCTPDFAACRRVAAPGGGSIPSRRLRALAVTAGRSELRFLYRRRSRDRNRRSPGRAAPDHVVARAAVDRSTPWSDRSRRRRGRRGSCRGQSAPRRSGRCRRPR